MRFRVYQTIEEHFDIEIPDGLDDDARAEAIDAAVDAGSDNPVFDQVSHRSVEPLS